MKVRSITFPTFPGEPTRVVFELLHQSFTAELNTSGEEFLQAHLADLVGQLTHEQSHRVYFTNRPPSVESTIAPLIEDYD